MPFWRSWGAALLGASGVALLVPVGLLLVVVVAAGLSGATGFGRLSQVAAGPALPAGGGLSARDGARLPSVPRPRASSPGGRRGAAIAVAAPVAPLPGSRVAPAPAPAGRRPTPPHGPVRTPTAPTSTGTPGSGTPPPTTTTTPTAPAAPLPALVDGVQQALEGVPVVGPAAADAVGSVAGLILPPGSLPPRTP